MEKNGQQVFFSFSLIVLLPRKSLLLVLRLGR